MIESIASPSAGRHENPAVRRTAREPRTVMAVERRLEQLTLETSDGVTLRAELIWPNDPVAAAVICHPHPLYGGSMDNNVVVALFDHLAGAGVAGLRFNFRGVNGSDGLHGGGRDERLDVLIAVDELKQRRPDLPLILAGYSFGADVALSVVDPGIAAWLAVAPPMRVIAPDEMAAGVDPRPKAIITGSFDDFRPPDEVRRLTAGWTNTTVDVAEGATHFFAVGMNGVTDTASEVLRRVLPTR